LNHSLATASKEFAAFTDRDGWKRETPLLERGFLVRDDLA
jgi:hypothetical protein